MGQIFLAPASVAVYAHGRDEFPVFELDMKVLRPVRQKEDGVWF
jgi:hypothetical protein